MKTVLNSIIPTLIFMLWGLCQAQLLTAQVQTGKSYVNITKGATGGTFEPGDILEIRAAIAVGAFSPFSITQVRYNDTIDNNFTYITSSLKILTNEGLSFRTYTDVASDDQATYNAVAKNLRINLGATATNAINTGNAAATAGTIANTNKPSFFGGVCIMVASFRVRINTGLSYNTMITLPGGAFRYTNSGSPVTVNFPESRIMIFENLGRCSNFVGSNALIENNGSFGSGITQNRSSSAIVPGYIFTNFSANMPNDGYYAIANNTSATGATNNGVVKPHSSRVFNLWDIIGDHTGATNPATGNPAAAPGTPGGYMAVVNASYATSPAIRQSVTNLCTNTYYDFSAWFRNICSLCASDSNGTGATSGSFAGPYKPGVKPNLTFQLDGIDYYTTGDLPYDGFWTKKGFTYLTGAAQTAFTLTIRNNSPGGGGNDWAVDDVSLSTCEPNVDLNITPVLLGCPGTVVDFSVTVKCYFPNYTFYKWQRSTNGGATWTDISGANNGVPEYGSGQWEYSATLPSFIANKSDSGYRYRVIVATSSANLSSAACSYSNNQSTMLQIIDCPIILNTQLASFSGQLAGGVALLKWISKSEANLSNYEIEKSDDGIRFTKAGMVAANNNSTGSSYQFSDVTAGRSSVYYRLKMIAKNGAYSYSNILLLENKIAGFAINTVTNPFNKILEVSYTLPRNGKLRCYLYDSYGKLVQEKSISGVRGTGLLQLETVGNLPGGVYTITLVFDEEPVIKRVIKMN